MDDSIRRIAHFRPDCATPRNKRNKTGRNALQSSPWARPKKTKQMCPAIETALPHRLPRLHRLPGLAGSRVRRGSFSGAAGGAKTERTSAMYPTPRKSREHVAAPTSEADDLLDLIAGPVTAEMAV
ncbi:MAG TPA: hypothetical protein VFO53_00375, partial [Casimicrobiaceae bacterium]|nr:hypothetical protein [Casimicrobiaceae bacterium]